jgi:hypothetical protein
MPTTSMSCAVPEFPHPQRGLLGLPSRFTASYMLGRRGAGASGRCIANQQWLALVVVVAIIGLIASVTYWQQLSAAAKFLAGH